MSGDQPGIDAVQPTLIAVRDYISPRIRELSPAEASVRQIAIDLKRAEPQAVRAAAAAMTPIVARTPRPILIPIPSSTGDLAANTALAREIALRAGGTVVTAVARIRPVESSRLRRMGGEPGLTRDQQAASMTLVGVDWGDTSRTAWLVDNVITTGATMLGAWDAMGRPPHVRGIAWAKAEENPMLRRNHGRADLTTNPAWLARAVVDHFELIRAAAPPNAMPELDRLRAEGRGNKVRAELAQLGCGAYGCVLETGDPELVFKVTADSTEVEFVRQVLPRIQPDGIVRYVATVDLPAQHKGSPLFALWREAADGIGQVSPGAVKLLRRAHAISDGVFGALHQSGDPHRLYMAALAAGANGSTPPAKLARQIEGMVKAWQGMSTHDELEPVGRALLAFFEAGVLVADVHEGNVGHVNRGGDDLVVITDPGHTAVLPQVWR